MKIKSIVLLVLLVLASCSPFQKAMKSEDNALKYQVADTLFQKGKYDKAIRLFEQLVPSYKGKPQAERMFFQYAESLFKTKQYALAAYEYERFHANYPRSEKAEESLYKSGLCYSKLSPVYSLDQVDTYKAIDKMQIFIDKYPDSPFIADANKIAQSLQSKIEKKFYLNAKQYHLIYDYKSAVVALENFIQDFPGTSYKEDAYYYKLDASYQVAINSFETKMKPRLQETMEIYEKMIKLYPNSKYLDKINKIKSEVQEKLQNLAK